MKVTKWIRWNTEDDSNEWKKPYIDPYDERRKLWNPDKKIFSPTKEEVNQYAANFYVTKEEALEKLLERYEALPDYVDEKKANEWLEIGHECEKALIDYCVKNHVFLSDYDHQGNSKGVPVFDDKYILTYTLRSWAALMADVWNEILGLSFKDKYNYLNFYCNGCPKEVEEYIVKNDKGNDNLK